MFYQLAGRALADRVHRQLIRISVSVGSDNLNVTIAYASVSQAVFSLGNCSALSIYKKGHILKKYKIWF